MNSKFYLFALISSALFWIQNPLLAQTTWTGAVNTLWANPSNWSAGIPDAFDDVTVPNATNSPTISAAGAAAKSIRIESGGLLTLSATGILTISGSGSQGMENLGTVTNSGILRIEGASNYGLRNEGKFDNTGGQIHIDRATVFSLYNNSGTFTNQGDITIGALAGSGSNGIRNQALFNHTSGTIRIDQFASHGIDNNTNAGRNNAVFNNRSTIIIGTLPTTGRYSIFNIAVFNNLAGSEIQMDRCPLDNDPGGVFTNQAVITLGATVSPGTNALINSGTFSNNTGGVINIDRSSNTGIRNYEQGIFTNHATINIGMAASIGLEGIVNMGNFNHSAGQISINNARSNGLSNAAGGVFHNLSTLVIGPAISGSACLSNYGNFKNDSGQISMNGTALNGLWNYFDATFSNQATITIGSASGANERGLTNNGSFTNLPAGRVQIDRSNNSGIHNTATFTNAGGITVGGIASVGLYGINNASVFTNDAGGVIKVDRCNTFGVTSQTRFTNNGMLTIGSTANGGTQGFSLIGTLSNSGQIHIDRTGLAGMAVVGEGSKMINTGIVRIGALENVGINGIYLTGGPDFFNQQGGQVYIDHAITGVYAEKNAAFTNLADVTIGALAPVTRLIYMQPDSRSSPHFFHYLGATLKGSGTISTGFLCDGGILSPGIPLGSMTVDMPENGLFQGAMFIDINGTGTPGISHDQITATGRATLSRMALKISINYIPTNGDKISILNATTVVGTFKEISGLPDNWVVNYTPTAVILSYESAPLPVSLVSFSGKKMNDNQNNLRWITSDEKDFDRFDIQRSADAKNFETIGTLSGQKIAIETVSNQGDHALHTYTFTDKFPVTSSYYRLKMVDLDGTFKYSGIISIESSVERAVVGSFYPNPSSGQVFMDVFAVESGRWTITVLNASGIPIDTKKYDLHKGINKITIDHLSSGISLVRFEFGLFSEVKRVMRE